MQKLILKPKDLSGLPIEADNINPDSVTGKTLKEIETLAVYEGNKTKLICDFFDIEGETAVKPEEQSIIIDGDIPNVKYVGANMTNGLLVVNGDVGMHLGSSMSGGKIHVKGSTSNWSGAEMKGGYIKIEKDAGNQLGCAYRGSSEGMTGGCIHVKGSAGIETGAFMRRGMIVVEEDVKPFLGAHMNGGEIFVFGRMGKRAGAEAKGNGGFIACLGEVESLLPTYIYDTTYRPVALRLYIIQLKEELGINLAEKFIDARFKRYRGDLAVGGNAEIFIVEE